MRYERDAVGDEPQCRNCGRKVDATLARVLGDNDGHLPACRECTEAPSGNSYVNDSMAAISYWARGQDGRRGRADR
jgi:hypothetical protein